MITSYDSEPLSFADILTGDEGPQPDHSPSVETEQPELQTFFVRAIYDYQSTDASSLSFQRGALIEVLTQLESGWWDGLLGDERGWFPSNYVEAVSDEEAEQELASRDAAAATAAPQEQQDWQNDEYPEPEPPVTVNGHAAARADDFWMPQVTTSGQIFFVNTRTGEQSAEIPSNNIDAMEEAPEFAIPQSSQLPTSASRSRSDTFATVTSSITSASIPTPTPASAGFVPPSSKEEEVPPPWIKRLVGDGLAYFYLNQETGQVRWSAPSPVTGARQGGRLPTLQDGAEDSDWSATNAYGSSQDISPEHGITAPAPADARRLSVYSDDSEVHPLEAPPSREHASRNHSTQSSNSSPERTDLTGTLDNDHEHENGSQPTSTASAELHSAESLARQLQMQMLPPAPETMDSLSASAREAISAVVEAVGESSEHTAPGQPTEMAIRVAAVVNAVRNLLYVSGTFTTPVSNLHLSRHVGSSAAFEEALETGRTPLMELKPFQRKVTATLSKLVLSARAADSNRDWPYDDAASRVDNDASELERAVLSFVLEVKRMEIVGGIVLNEKRLKGVLVSGEGLLGIGTAVYGGGAAGSWKGLGFAPLDSDTGVVPPHWPLGPSVINDMKACKAALDEGVDGLCQSSYATVEQVIPHIRQILATMHSFLAVAEDIDIARNVDVDGDRIEQLSNQADAGAVDAYAAQVQLAKTLIRKLEVDKQAIYDDGAYLWNCAQSAFADFLSSPPKLLKGVGLALSRRWENHTQRLHAVALSLKSAILDTLEGFQALHEVSAKQDEAVHQKGIRGSIGLRDGQMTIAQRKHMSAPPGFGLKSPLSPESADSEDLDEDQMESHLNMGLGGVDEEASEDDELVDVGFALGKGKARAVKQQHQLAAAGTTVVLQTPQPNQRPAQQKAGQWLALEPQSGAGRSGTTHSTHSASSSTAVATLGESEKDGTDGASTIRQSADDITLAEEDEDDEDDEDYAYHPVRKPTTMKSPSRAAKITKIFGEDAPAHYIATQNAAQQAWYLKNDNDDKDILINPDGGVRGGTLKALVERLTLHTSRDAVFIDTFLITFKSFTTVDELFDLLAERFNIPEPSGLSAEEKAQWVEKKLTPVRFRVINILRSLIVDKDVLEKEDMHILQRIHDFAVRITRIAPAAKQLVLMVERAQSGAQGRVTQHTTMSDPPPSIAPKTKQFKLLDIDPLEMARQLTIMESRLYFMIRPMECLARAKEQPGEDDSIRRIIGTSNKIASWVAESVLSKDDPKRRAMIIRHFISIAEKCRELGNFSTMAALIAGLNSPPIRRLKRSWEPLHTRTIAQLDDVEKTLDSGKNFTGYRQLLATVSPPCVPFLGVYLTVLTFIQDGNKDILVKEGNLINFNKRQKAAEVIREIKKYQSKPYNLSEIPSMQEYLENALARVETAPDFWEISMQLEPREREDEKMARLLQESGFL